MKSRFLFAAAAACALLLVPGWGCAAEKAPVLMIGDSMMRLLGIALEKELKSAGVQPASTFTSLGSGLARMDALDWFSKVASLMKEQRPATVVVSLGANDRQALKDTTGRVVNFGTPEWDKEYALRVGRIMDELIAGGVNRIIWLLLPDMKDPVHQEYAVSVNALYAREAAAESRKEKVVLFDMRPLLSRKPGTFSLYMMSSNGEALSVRDTDGVHLSPVGAQRVAQAISKTYFK